jgi:hypothetical protein
VSELEKQLFEKHKSGNPMQMAEAIQADIPPPSYPAIVPPIPAEAVKALADEQARRKLADTPPAGTA